MTVQGITNSDFNALNELKVRSQNNADAAKKQLEGTFLQSMLKSMRMEEHFLEEPSPFRCKEGETFQDILNTHYSIAQNIGSVDRLAKQIESNQLIAEQPAEVARPTNINSSSLPIVSVNQSENNKHATTIDDFVKSIWPKAKQAASLIGLDPKVLIAQAALETGWGKFVAKDVDGSSSNNFFNIKAASNSKFDSVHVNTKEYIANTPIKVDASFRKYLSIEDSFHDYISLIKGSERYQNTLANAGNPELYVNELHKAGYATDPDYSTKILSIYHGDKLNQAIQRSIELRLKYST